MASGLGLRASGLACLKLGAWKLASGLRLQASRSASLASEG